MTSKYVDNRGHLVEIGSEIGAGGEGIVYHVRAHADLVAKIYHKPAPAKKATKLRSMVDAFEAELASVSAWPTATLHDRPHGNVRGILLPKIRDACEVHELYSPAHRRLHFPHADWRLLIRAATNCAIAFYKMHSYGIVIGDVNQGNVFITKRATVNLIDCDSFQFQKNGRLYRCEVGVAHFTPPELLGKNFRCVERTTNHDCFGLAVLLFHLLFMGRHPYAGRYSGPGDMPIEKAIWSHRFAYGRDAQSRQMAPPPHALSLDGISPQLAEFFEEAFSSKSKDPRARPSAQQWAHALIGFEKQLRSCSDDLGHKFFSQLNACPWCRIAHEGGPNFFFTVTLKAMLKRETTFNLGTLWAQITKTEPPPTVFAPAQWPPDARVIPTPFPWDEQTQTNIARGVTVLSLAGVAMVALSSVIPLLAPFGIAFAVLFGVWRAVLYLTSPLSTVRRRRKKAARFKVNELKRAYEQREWMASLATAEYRSRLNNLSKRRRRYERQRQEQANAMSRLQASCRQRQLDEFLRSHFISDAKIGHIGVDRSATLQAYGIETAYDVVGHRIRSLPGFGPRTTYNLMRWRTQIESTFTFDPKRGVPVADLQAFQIRHVAAKAQLERQLQRGPYQLRTIADTARRDLDALSRLIGRLDFEATQAAADVEACHR